MIRYGFLGLGIMGSAMAANLVDAGLDVTVWNRSREKCLPLVERGATLGNSPGEVVAQCDLTITMVSDPVAAASLCFGTSGVLEGLKAGKGYIDASTVDPATAIHISEAVTAKGGHFLEAPVLGSKKPAEDGTLIFLCSGAESLYHDAGPILQLLGKKSYFFPKIGQGAQMKLVVNMIMGTVMSGFSEGLALGDKAGLAMTEILDVLTQGPIDNPMFRLKGPQMAQNSFSTAFPLKHMQKDMRLALQMADEYGQPLFTAAAANNLYLRTREAGGANDDFSAILRTILGQPQA